MDNSLSREITPRSLIKFVFPTVVMLIFMSMYTIVDGAFVSRLIGTNALSAVNIVYPLVSLTVAFGIMLGTGGSAVIAKKFGEGKDREANENFTMITIAGLIAGIVLAAVCLLFLEPIIQFLGANEAVYDYCIDYIRPLLFFFPAGVVQLVFQSMFVAAGKPKFGLILTIIAGLANAGLDYLFIAVFNMGIAGAAYATGIGYCIPTIAGLVYFLIKKKDYMHFVRPAFDKIALIKSCTNGSSEMVSNLAGSVITLLFNLAMMHFVGEDGVAAISIVLYAEFLIIALFLGYSSGIAPIISYNYGSQNKEKLKRLFRISVKFIATASLILFAAAFLTAPYIVTIFTPRGTEVYDLAVHGFYLYSFCYLFKGFNTFASAMFTAFSDGKISAILSFLRTLVFIVFSILLLTIFFGVNGVWLSVPLAEFLAIILSIFFVIKKRKKYHYI